MRFVEFMRRSVSESDMTPSSKRVISYFVVFVYSTILLCAFFLGFAITDPVLHMADMLLSAGLGTYVIGRYAESRNNQAAKKIDDSKTKVEDDSADKS